MSDRPYSIALIIILLISGACHVRQYLADRSFWHDEASLVLNIRNRTAPQLLGKLDYEQAAPPLFLLAERGIDRTMGGSELALRSLPFACGLVSVLLMTAIARRVLPRPWDLLAIFLFGTSDMMIWHSTEVKQYGTDVFVALLLTWLALQIGPWPSVGCALAHADPEGSEDQGIAAPHPVFKPIGFLVFCIVATAAVWFSYPAALVFAGLSLTLLLPVSRQRQRGWVAWLAGNAMVGISFLAVLVLVVHKQQDASLTGHWKSDFVDLHHPWRAPGWLLSRLLGLCDYPVKAAGPVILAAAAIGAFALLRKGRMTLLGLLLGPVVMTLAAAAAQRFPFDGARLTAFLVPDLLLLAQIGLSYFTLGLWPRISYAALIPAVYVIGVGLYWAGLNLATPQTRGHLRPVARYVLQHAQPTDGIYALEHREWICYWPQDDQRVRPEMDEASEIPFTRFWVIWSFSSDHGRHRVDPVLNWIESFADQRDSFIEKSGGEAFLFERHAGATPADNQPPNIDTQHKLMRPKKTQGREGDHHAQ
jgi:hypothetical protein